MWSTKISSFGAGVVLIACQTITPPRLETDGICPFRVHGSQVVGETVECGFLDTFEEHSSAKTGIDSTRRVKVAYLLFKSTADSAPAAQRTVLVHLAGGPSQSWADLGLEFITKEQSQKQIHDMLFVEQRGTGVSEPQLRCRVTGNAARTAAEFARTCAEQLARNDIRPEAYNVEEMAADVGDLRVALGYRQIVLIGVSYGTAWGLEIMRQQGDHVLGAVLDSVVTPTIPPLSRLSSARAGAFYHVLEACRVDAACNQAYPDLVLRFEAAVLSLQQDPLPVNSDDDASDASPTGTFDGADLVGSMMGQLEANPLMVPFMVDSISQHIQGRLPLVVASDGGDDNAAMTRSATGQYLSVACSDNQFVDQAALERDDSDTPSAVRGYVGTGQQVMQMCQVWPYKRRERGVFSPVSSSTPTLLLAGTADPRTPPSWAEEAAQTLSTRLLVVAPLFAHHVAAQRDRCIASIQRAFVRSPGIVDSSCLSEIQPRFILPDQAARELAPTWKLAARDGFSLPMYAAQRQRRFVLPTD